jgi:hypothetical protein
MPPQITTRPLAYSAIPRRRGAGAPTVLVVVQLFVAGE